MRITKKTYAVDWAGYDIKNLLLRIVQIVRDRTVVAAKQVTSIIRLAEIVNQSNVRFVVTMLTVHQMKLLEQTQVNIFVDVILDMKEIRTLNVLISMSVLGA